MKLKNVILFILIAMMATSCMMYKGYYDMGLQEVERPENAEEQYGESKIVTLEEDGKSKISYEDELIKIVWLPLSTQFSFNLKNKTDHSIKIIWDEAVYVDENGSSGRVMHSGVKYTDRNNPQPPTIVVKNANIDDIIVPTDNIYYVSGQYGGWQTKPLLPNKANTEEELNTLTQSYIDKKVQVVLPIEIEDTVNEYIFKFKVDDFKKL
ncbi:MAG: hypothetical protein PF486_10135 [Prolixibacteraceae bacterium]|jgi:biopolymer transport protein ExbD|nr:hypothetical protein [Prolixibacteraceae bacterium]